MADTDTYPKKKKEIISVLADGNTFGEQAVTVNANARDASWRVFLPHLLAATWCLATTIESCQWRRPEHTSTTKDVENVAD